nr:hypothetical protein [Terrimicrobium sacchariphilum]
MIELLVAVAVLSVILLLLSQMVSLASKTWSTGRARVDNFTQARTVLGLMDRDIQSSVLRRDLASFVDTGGKPALAFLTRVSSPGQERKLALVAYQMTGLPTAPELIRYDYGYSFDSTSTPPYGTHGLMPDLDKATSQALTDGVLRLEVQFVLADGTLSKLFQYDYDNPSSTTNARSLVLSLLVIDSTALKLAKDTGRISELMDAFSGTPDPNESYAAYWNDLIRSGSGIASLPEPLRVGLKSFERQVALPIATIR